MKRTIKVKVLFITGGIQVKFTVDENDVFFPSQPFVVENLDVNQYQILMGIVMNTKRWLQTYNGKSLEIEVEEP